MAQPPRTHAGTRQQALQAVTTGTRFVAKAEPPTVLAEPSDHPAQNLRAVLKNTDVPHLAATPIPSPYAHPNQQT